MTLLEAPRSIYLVVMLTVCAQAEDGLPALAGGEQEEYHSWPARPGGDRHHKRSNGTLQDADSRRATGNETLRGSEGRMIKDTMQVKNVTFDQSGQKSAEWSWKSFFQNYCWPSWSCAPLKVLVKELDFCYSSAIFGRGNKTKKYVTSFSDTVEGVFKFKTNNKRDDAFLY